MSSASSGRYQSRLFNFFHRQSRQLKQQSDRALRNLRVAATWVATVGLYPLYLLVQSTSSVARQVNQAVQQSLPQLPANNLDYLETPPSTDTPIQRVLLAVDTLPSEEALISTSQNQKPANLLAFLVSNAQNIASLWRFKFFSKERQEARGKRQEAEGKINSSELLTVLDRTVARLESNHLAPVGEIASTLSASSFSRGWKLVQQVQKLTGLSSWQLGSKIPASATLNNGMTLNGFESYKFRLQTLIFAAINYFFGSHSSKQAIATSPKTNLTQAKLRNQRTFKLPTAAPVERDPWLTLDDLFGEPELPSELSIDQQNASTQIKKQLTGNTNLMPFNLTRHSLGNLRDRFLKKLPQSKQVSGRVLGQKTPKGRQEEVGSKQLSSLPKSTGYTSASQISKQRSTQNTQVEAKPDWIETNATAMGYVKHPLEKILEWLDRLILWLEEMLVRVLGRLQRLWQGK